MKKLFFLLLAANVGYFLWHFMIEMPRGFDGPEISELHLPDGVETIVLVSELDKNILSATKTQVRQVRNQGGSPISENTTKPTDSWLTVEAISERVFNRITSIQYSLAVDSIVHGFERAYEVGVASIPPLVEGVRQINLAEKFDSLPKFTQKYSDIRPPGNARSKTKQCYELGPFHTMEAVKTIVSRMDSKAPWHQIDSSWDEVRVGFWVLYHPGRPPENFEASKANLEMLKSRGITDTWLFTAGDLRGSISLGLFKSKTRAIGISKKLRAKGLNSVVQPWFTEIEQHRLQIQWNDTRALLESWLVPYSGKDRKILITVIENCGRQNANKLIFSQR